MDNTQHLILSHLREQSVAIKALVEQTEKSNELLTHLVKINMDILQFFVGIDERESGVDPTLNQEYLTEIEKDGFNPNTG